MLARLFKLVKTLSGRRPQKLARFGALLVLAGFAAQPGCNFQPRKRVVTVQDLENASETRPILLRRAVISNWNELEYMYWPLGERLAMFQTRNRDDWTALQKIAPEIGPSPDFEQGAVVALISRAGMPVNGDWPISLDSVHIAGGAGFARGAFTGGTYLPNGAAFMEIAQFDGLAAVVMLEIDGMRFYPE